MRRLWLVAAIALLSAGPAGRAGAVPALIADLSSHQIDITTGFSGTRLLLFGATEGVGDILVVVRGPQRREVVRRKQRIAGIWVNRQSVTFENVPAYYFEASTRPLLDITDEATLKRLQIGATRLPVRAEEDDLEIAAGRYWEALLRLKRNRKLYTLEPAPVTVIGNRLFRVELVFPANVPTGTYIAEIYLFRDAKPVSVERRVLLVRRAGAEAAIFDFAHQHAAIYGIVAVVVALLAGWLAGVVFRKV